MTASLLKPAKSFIHVIIYWNKRANLQKNRLSAIRYFIRFNQNPQIEEKFRYFTAQTANFFIPLFGLGTENIVKVKKKSKHSF